MPSRHFFVSLFASCCASLLVLWPAGPVSAQLQPSHYETTLRLQQPVFNGGIDTVVFRWSTFESAGPVGVAELQDLSMSLYAGGSYRYSDTVVVDGVAQLFEGMVRVPETDYFWDFDLDSMELQQMLNISSELAIMTPAEHFVVNDSISIQDDNIVDVTHFKDGEVVSGASDQLDTQDTVPMLFFDGFETGDTSVWSRVTP